MVLKNVRCETSLNFRHEHKINKLETNSKNRNIRDLYRSISKFRMDISLEFGKE